jgi:SAM-dependent methyltransferase
MTTTSCPACTSTASEPVERFSSRAFLARFMGEFDQRFDPAGADAARALEHEYAGEYDIRRCTKCGLQFCDPMRAGTSAFYDAVYRHMPVRSLPWDFTQFRAIVPAGARVLDVGCGGGSFVAMARMDGYDAEGIDFNPDLVAGAAAAGLPVSAVDISGLEAHLRGRQYDAFTMWQVLEHLEDPAGTLRQLRAVASPKTILVVAVPSDRFYLAERSRRPVTDYPPHHLTRWTPIALRAAAERAGWQVTTHRYEPASLGEMGKRLVKSTIINRSPVSELRNFFARRRFSERAFLPDYDRRLNNVAVKAVGKVVAAALQLDARGLSGMSQCVVMSPRMERA